MMKAMQAKNVFSNIAFMSAPSVKIDRFNSNSTNKYGACSIYGLCFLLPIVLAAFSIESQAETFPDAGATYRNIVPEIRVIPKSEPTLTLPDVGKGEILDQTPFIIKRFHIEGASLIPEPTLQELIANLVGDARTLADLNKATARITNLYRDQGYPLARAYLAPQEIADGTVLITVLEGTLGGIKLENGSRLTNQQAEAIAHHIQQGETLRLNEVNRAILLLRDTPGVGDVQASFAAGDKTGETLMTLDLTPAPLITGRLEADNYGSLYTGRQRAGGSVNLNSLLGYGERISAQVLASEESLYYGRLAVQVPFGSNGLSLGVNLSHVQYELGDVFKNLKATGRVNSSEMSLAYPFVRDLMFNLYGQANIKYSDLKDEIRVTETVTDKTTKKATLSLIMNSRDQFLSGGANQAYLGFSSGQLAIDSPSVQALDAILARTEGSYRVLNIELSRLQSVTNRITLSLSAKGQIASKNLDSSEKFFLGGPYAIRAYPVGEATGDQGWLGTAEARFAFLPNVYGSVFYDVGAIRVNQNSFLTTPNGRRLSGSGIGLGGSYKTFNWKSDIAWRGTEEPVAEKDKTPRVWLQGSFSF